MRQFQGKPKYISLKQNYRTRGYQVQTSYKKYNDDNKYKCIELKEETKLLSKHTKTCGLQLRNICCVVCHEPVGHPTPEYRHQHQQYIRKHLEHAIQRYYSRYTPTSESPSQSSASPSNFPTNFFHLIFSGWNNKSYKSFAKLQPKPNSSPTICSRSYFWKLCHQTKNASENSAGRLLRWSSSNRGGSIEKKQFDRQHRLFRNGDFIKRKQQQQQQRSKQVKHIELLFYNAFVKDTFTTRKY